MEKIENFLRFRLYILPLSHSQQSPCNFPCAEVYAKISESFSSRACGCEQRKGFMHPLVSKR